jgi:hypothetical protein
MHNPALKYPLGECLGRAHAIVHRISFTDVGNQNHRNKLLFKITCMLELV